MNGARLSRPPRPSRLPHRRGGGVFRGHRFDAVIFDHDGTLVDTVTGDFMACRDLFAELGVALSPGSWASAVCGNVAAYTLLFDELAAAYGCTMSHAELRARLEVHWARNLVVPHVTLLEGARELLVHLHGMRVPMGIASAATVAWVERWLTHFELRPFFHSLASGADCAKNKPEPDVYLRAASELGASPRACLVFEDSTTGIQAAKAAGMHVVAIPTSFGRHLDFRDADAVVTNLRQVLSEIHESNAPPQRSHP